MPQTWWVTDFLKAGGPIFLFSWVVWVIGSITLHELSHGWAAIRHGDRTPIETGHMTLNPLVHMGPTSLIMFALVGIAWGLMPIDPSRMRGRYAEAKVAAAGPLMNISLALVAVIGATVVKAISHGQGLSNGLHAMDTLANFYLFFKVGAMLNLTLAAYNLVPVPPLDGWRIGCAVSRTFQSAFGSEAGIAVGTVGTVLLFYVGGSYIFAGAAVASLWLIHHAELLVGLP